MEMPKMPDVDWTALTTWFSSWFDWKYLDYVAVAVFAASLLAAFVGVMWFLFWAITAHTFLSIVIAVVVAVSAWRSWVFFEMRWDPAS